MASSKVGPICIIKQLPHQPSPKRGCGILVFQEERQVTASEGYNGLGEKQRWILKAIDWWVSGAPLPKSRGHGFNKRDYGGKYAHCFVFKTSDDDRLYGFLCHPKRDDPSYMFCTLVAYMTKNQWETDEAMLRISERMRNNLTVRQALSRLFPDSSGGNGHGTSKRSLDRKRRC